MFSAAVAAVAPETLIRRITFLPDGVEYAGTELCPA